MTSLCLFGCCSCHRGFTGACSDKFVFIWMLLCHRGFTGACSDKFVFICMLLLPSGLYRCLNLLFTLTLTTGAFQVLVVTRLCLFACCSCHRGFADALICCAPCSCHRGFAGVLSGLFVFTCMLLLPSGPYSCFNLLCTLLLQ